jgi:hypothetical protein
MSSQKVNSFRFKPPRLGITPEMRWALVRGFAPVDAVLSSHGGQPDPNLAFYYAVRFGLASRIAIRIPAKQLQSELGVEFARQLELSRVAAVRLERCVNDTARSAAEIAAERAIPLVFTKEVALRLLGASVETRACGNIHVLVPFTRAKELHEMLQVRGFSWYLTPGSISHCADLVEDPRAAVELHVHIPTHRCERERAFCSAEALLASGLVVRTDALPGDAWIPKRPILLAQVIAEGFAVRGTPGCSPLFRMLSRVIDLDVTQDPEIQSFLCHGRLADDMSLFEVRAVCLLARALREGRSPEDVPRGSPSHLLLHHILAGILHPGYEQSQRFDFSGSDPTGRSRLLAPLDRLLRARVPKRATLAPICGRSRSQPGWVALRLHCPVDAFFCLQQSISQCSVARNATNIGSAVHVLAPTRSE